MTNFAGGPLLLPPPMEELTIAWLQQFLSPIPVVTRLPTPASLAATISGVLKVEAGGGTQANKTQWDMTILLHAYHPDEAAANLIADQAISLMAIARGQTINGFYVVTVEDAAAPHRQTDPDVSLPRYFATATWRVAGQPWTPTPTP